MSIPMQTSAQLSARHDGTDGSVVNASRLSRADRVRAQSAKGKKSYNEAYQFSRKYLLILLILIYHSISVNHE